MTVAARSSWSSWLLTKAERANAQTVLDDVHPGERAWSQGKHVRPLVHGATYFAELAQRPDLVHRLRGDPDEQLTDDPSSTAVELLGPRTDGASTSVG